ncbi:hypothetical protein PSACC_03349 [Paramicrosporidium saccamoebae]|uniref:Sister chromatid cohesion protein n=1 Tax=Paramicrosporidium saccamoebae TaxID=1246581 RepID=A0A2H9TGE0_9FUNG|nr:hypothetical protein PSACC_03349 [Paramicrosporidium saccamoebae]
MNTAEPIVGGMVSGTPLTPESEDWDKSSVLRDMSALRPKIVLRIGNRPDNSVEESETQRQAVPKVRIKVSKKQPVAVKEIAPPVDNTLDIINVPLGEVGEQVISKYLLSQQRPEIPSKLSERIMDYLETFQSIETVGLAALCLLGGRLQDKIKAKLAPRIESVWEVLRSSIPVKDQVCLLRVGLSELVAFIQTVKVDEAWLLSLSTSCVKSLNSMNLDQDIIGLLVELLVVSSSKSNVIRGHVIDESMALEDASLVQCLDIERLSLPWYVAFLIMDFTHRLQCIPSEEAKQKPKLSAFLAALDQFFSSIDSLTIKMLDWLEKVAKGAVQLSLLPSWLPTVIIVKHIYSLVLKALMSKDLKSDIRLRLLDIGGTIVAAFRKVETLGITASVPPYQALAAFSDSVRADFVNRRIVSERLCMIFGIGDFKDLLDNIEYDAQLGCFLKSFDVGPSSDKFLGLLLQSLNDPGPLIRARSIKEFQRIIKLDDPIVKNEHFIATIQRRIDDASPSVRESAIDFIVAIRHSDAKDVIILVLDKFSDSSLSVRKKAIKLASDYLIQHPDDANSADIKAALLCECVSDIKVSADLAFSNTLSNWISPIIKSLETVKVDGNTVVWRQTLALFTADIVKTIRSPRSDLNLFKAFFAKLSFDPMHGPLFVEVCEGIVDLLFETLVSSIEEGSTSATKFILASLVTIIGDRDVGVSKHFRLICSLILSDDPETVEHSLLLVQRCLQGDDHLIYRQDPELCGNLFKLAFRGSEAIIRGSLMCLFDIAKTSTQVKSQLGAMFNKMTKFIAAKSKVQDPETVHLLCRGVLGACLIARMGKDLGFSWPITTNAAVHLVSLVKENPNRLVDVFCNVSIAELIVADPLSSLQEPMHQMIMDGLDNGCESSILALLKGFHEMLKKDKQASHESSFVVDAEAKLDYSSSLSTVYQNFLVSIRNTARIPNPEVIESCGLLLASMLRRGMSHPHALVPHVLRLWQCPWPKAAARLHEVCIEVVDRFEAYVSSSLSQVVKLSYEWGSQIQPDMKGYVLDEDNLAQSYYSPLYEALKTKTKRLDLISALLREMEHPDPDLNYIQFVSEALAELSYKTMDEVSVVIKRLSDIVAFDDDLHDETPKIIEQLVTDSKGGGMQQSSGATTLPKKKRTFETRLLNRRPKSSIKKRRKTTNDSMCVSDPEESELED